MPELQGREKKFYFNMLSGCVALGLGLGGAATGAALAGPLGAVAGLGAGLGAGSTLVVKGRFYRP
jgi:hypothetical protein